MKRMKVLFGNRRMMVMLTLAILVLAAAALIASSASFTAQSANIDNTFAAGNLSLDGENVLFNGKLWPGHTLDGTCGVTVHADGAAQLWLKVLAYSTPSVADVLTLDVWNSANDTHVAGPWEIDSAALQNGVLIGTGLTDGQAASYTFRVGFPDGDANGGATLADKGADNAYKNTNATVRFAWVAASQ